MSHSFRLREDLPADLWSERVSHICGLCGGSVDSDEHDDLAEMHPEDCAGCPICEIPIRLFQELPDGRVLGCVFHFNCFESLLETKGKA
jgi:hypothetical protein